jgi:hypothetical protein
MRACRKVEEWHQERAAPGLAVDKEELRRQRGGDWRRWLTMKLLHEKGGLTQRAADRMMGMKNGSEVSRYLRKLEEKARTDAQCRAELMRRGKLISS